MTDLASDYLGLRLASPLVPSASPLTGELDSLRRLEAAGAGAVVLPSVFEEQLTAQAPERRAGLAGKFARYNGGPDEHLRLVEAAAGALRIPVVASVAGSRPGEWTAYATRLERAGAAAIELSMWFVPHDPELDAGAVEQRYLDTLADLRSHVTLPVAVKLPPFFTAPANLARRMMDAGAQGFVAFHRVIEPSLQGPTDATALPLSSSSELNLVLRWLPVLRAALPELSLAASTGVHTVRDIVAALGAGADVAMVASALLRHGPEHLGVLRDGLAAWMQRHGLEDCQDLRSIRLPRERGYVETVVSYSGPERYWSRRPTGTPAGRWPGP